MSVQLFNNFKSNHFKQHMRTHRCRPLRLMITQYAKVRAANNTNTLDLYVREFLEAIHNDVAIRNIKDLRQIFRTHKMLGARVPCESTIFMWLEKYELNALGTCKYQSTQILRKYVIG